MSAIGGVPLAQQFYVTFGMQYPREPHPVWPGAHHDGYVVIVAPDERTARGAAFAAFGQHWSMIYEHEPDPGYFPLGELTRLVASYPPKED